MEAYSETMRIDERGENERHIRKMTEMKTGGLDGGCNTVSTARHRARDSEERKRRSPFECAFVDATLVVIAACRRTCVDTLQLQPTAVHIC